MLARMDVTALVKAYAGVSQEARLDQTSDQLKALRQ
jgi:hypothetical protein